MSLLVVGSIAFDSIRTPHGEVNGILGGSATFFSMSTWKSSEFALLRRRGWNVPPAKLFVGMANTKGT
jgi:hypothetical protein